jgi:ActR/RegA family two-component response regulator
MNPWEDSVKTVLLVDGDLGFVLWLGRTLYDAGYEAFPATTIPEAVAVINELKAKIDLLMVNPSLIGTTELVDSLCRARAGLRVLVLLDEQGKGAGQIPNADATIQKPPEAASAWWLGIVGQLLLRDCAA